MKKPKAINLFLDMKDEFSILSYEQVGRLVMALLTYAQDGEEPELGDDQGLNLLFRTMKKQIDRDFAKYEETCKRRTVAAKIAAGARYHKNYLDCESHANASDRCQYEDEDKNEYEYENENDDDDDDEEENKHDSAGAEDERLESLKYFFMTSHITFYLSQQAHKPLCLSDKSAQDLITRRLKEGYTEEELKSVIDRKCWEWLGTSDEEYLRPDVLFGEKLESYLRE